MASFDIMQAVFNAYQTIWRERVYLLRLGTVPFLIAYLNFVAVSLIDADITPLRRAILLLPAMTVEAWLVCQFLRTIMTGERWPMMYARTDGPTPAMISRVRGLLTGMIIYLLTVLTLNVFVGTLATLWESGELKKLIETGNPVYTLGNFLVIYIALRWFKLFWLHVPMVINLPPRLFLRALPGWMPSIHLIGLWLACGLPIMAAVVVLLGILGPLGLGHGSSAAAFVGFMFLKVLDVGAQLGVSLVGSTAVVYAIQPLLFPKAK